MNLIDRVRPIPDYIKSLTDELKSRGGKPKIPITSLPELNKKMWGFKDGELVVIGARTSQGKSSFVAQMAFDIADQGIPVLFLSLEMTVEEILERMFCSSMLVNNFSVISGEFNKSESIRTKFATFCEMVKSMKMIITCGVGQTFKEILQTIEVLDPQPRVIIVDYIQSIRSQPGETRESIDEYIRHFRQLALDNKFCGILCSQINRGAIQNKNSEPNMAQLKSSGGIEEQADKVILLHWDYHYTEQGNINDYTVMLAKNRNGRTGTHYLNFDPQYYKFYECSASDLARRRN